MFKVAFSLLLLVSASPLGAQSFDASQWTQGTTTITAKWRFHPGDNPAWASPSFDDSSWPLLATDQKWGSQGYPDLNGYAWYRLRLKIPATSQPLGIDIGHINSAAEIYAGGRLLGENGVMRPRPDWSDQQNAHAFPLPLSCNGCWVEIAVRVWKSSVASSYSLTFLSDGVVEAQSASGELFGFARTRGVAARSAEEIANAAQTFGQQDDITVLTLQFAPAEVAHA